VLLLLYIRVAIARVFAGAQRNIGGHPEFWYLVFLLCFCSSFLLVITTSIPSGALGVCESTKGSFGRLITITKTSISNAYWSKDFRVASALEISLDFVLYGLCTIFLFFGPPLNECRFLFLLFFFWGPFFSLPGFNQVSQHVAPPVMQGDEPGG
jgi:hypothetical protein